MENADSNVQQPQNKRQKKSSPTAFTFSNMSNDVVRIEPVTADRFSRALQYPGLTENEKARLRCTATTVNVNNSILAKAVARAEGGSIAAIHGARNYSYATSGTTLPTSYEANPAAVAAPMTDFAQTHANQDNPTRLNQSPALAVSASSLNRIQPRHHRVLFENTSVDAKASGYSKTKKHQEIVSVALPHPPVACISDSKELTSTRHKRPPDHLLQNAESPFTLLSVIGEGAYGEIFSAEHKENKTRVAIKRMKSLPDTLDSCNLKRIVREVQIFQVCNHDNIVQCCGIYADDRNMSSDTIPMLDIALEEKYTDMWKLSHAPQVLTEKHIRFLAFQFFAGLEYLHSAGIIHRDIKPPNILINQDCTLSITDFSLARVYNGTHVLGPMSPIAAESPMSSAGSSDSSGGCPSRQHFQYADPNSPSAFTAQNQCASPSSANVPYHFSTHVASRWYRDPHLILAGQMKSHYDYAVDIWAAGCVFAEMLGLMKPVKERFPLFPGATCFPFSANSPADFGSPRDQMNTIFSFLGTPAVEDILSLENSKAREYCMNLPRQEGRSLAEHLGREPQDVAIDLLKRCLHFNPHKRPTASQVLDHPYFDEFRERRALNKAKLWTGEKLKPFEVDFLDDLNAKEATRIIMDVAKTYKEFA
jgi:serine/threonine protein kinase